MMFKTRFIVGKLGAEALGMLVKGTTRQMSIVRKEGIIDLWKKANAVCFDVDSTVVTEEGIDVLADHCGAGEAVAEWTKRAMGGSVPFHVALSERLKLFEPSLQQINECNTKHPLELSPGIEELFKTLHERGVDVYLVSGGFRQMINPLATILKVPETRIYANNLLHDDTGTYIGFDPNEPTSRAGGKAKVVGMLKTEFKYETVFMVGDGATDMEARPPADGFIGYGGVVVRDIVKENSDWFVCDIQNLITPLK